MNGFLESASAAISAAIVLAVSASSAAADAVEDFYRGKTVTLVASTGAGGPVDQGARMLVRHWARHIPGNPNVVVKNMPGAGHVLASNFMANQAPKDGTTIATVVNGIALHQAISGRGVRYDARKFGWIGAPGVANLMTIVWHTSPVKTAEDLWRYDLPTGATGVGAGAYSFPTAMNQILGTRFKLVLGYPTAPAINIAMERGEIVARGGWSLSGIKHERPDWIAEKKINFIVQVGTEREQEYPEVPLMHELAKTPEQREILTLISSPVGLGRPIFGPPDMPADRLAALRKSFVATMHDERYLAEARQLHVETTWVSGEQLTQIVSETIDAPAHALTRARAVLDAPEGAR